MCFGYRDQVHAHNFYPEYLLDGTDSLRTRSVVPMPRGMGSGRASVRLDCAPDLLRARAFFFSSFAQMRETIRSFRFSIEFRSVRQDVLTDMRLDQSSLFIRSV